MEENEDFKNTAYHDLEEIQSEFLKYAPAYAQNEAREAIGKIIELQSQGLLRNGIYYITLVDLVGSTKYAAEYGNDKINQRIKILVKYSFDALTISNLTNAAIFLKEIGDAVLLIFQHFPDVLKWRSNLQEYLNIFDKPEPYQIRTCIHIGEVSLDGINPISLAVSQTFKMEKSIEAGEIGLTDIAYHVAWPTIARAYHGFTNNGTIELDGFKEAVKLHYLKLNDKDDLKRIVLENENQKEQ
jgi:class 3 adenylate cyclase